VTEDEDSSKIVEQTAEMSVSKSQSLKVWSVLYFTVVVIAVRLELSRWQWLFDWRCHFITSGFDTVVFVTGWTL